MQKTDYNNIKGLLLKKGHRKLAEALDEIDPVKLEAISEMVKFMQHNGSHQDAIAEAVAHDMNVCINGTDEPLYCQHYLTDLEERVPYSELDGE